MKLSYWLKCLPLLLLMTSFIPSKPVGASVITSQTANYNLGRRESYINRGYGQLQARIRSRIRFRLPSRGAPTGAIIGAVRGWSGECRNTPVALLPKTNLGLTTAAQPTIFLYIPPNSATSAKFVLQNGSIEQVYTTKLSIPSTSGVIGVTIPAQVASSLEVDKNYLWSFSISCDADDPNSDRAYVQGWIVRSNPSATTIRQLKTADPYERPAIYANEGYWYDTLATLAELRRANPKDTSLISEWSDLLKSVGLDSVAEKPLVSTVGK